MMNTSMVSTAAEKVPLGMKLGYSIGDFGANLAFNITGFYLMFFFTDVFGIVRRWRGHLPLRQAVGRALPTR
jgi:Na+/melibiose symporter-like transporter